MGRGRGAYEKVSDGGKFIGEIRKPEKEMPNWNLLLEPASRIQFVAVNRFLSLAKAVCCE
jgi:hypothetical protein